MIGNKHTLNEKDQIMNVHAEKKGKVLLTFCTEDFDPANQMIINA